MEIFGAIINVPPSVQAYGWIPFVVVILLSFLFSAFYVRYFWHSREKDKCSAVTSVLGLTVAFLAAALLPVDVFIVSFMKNPDGSFKDWATNDTRLFLENSVSYAYYSMYIIILVFAFLILPFVYFAFEEKDDLERGAFRGLGSAAMYTFVFLLLAVALLITGAFIPYRGVPPQNSTNWEKIQFIIDELYENRGIEALNFIINILIVLGMINLVLYTGIGMSYFPVSLMKGFRSLSEEENIISEGENNLQTKKNIIREKQMKKRLTSREIAQLAELEEQENLIMRRRQFVENENKGVLQKLSSVFRVINALFGVIGILFALLIWVSLLINNIDKLLNSLGYKMGYILKVATLPNPLDIIMVEAQKVFPIDYCLFTGMIVFLIMCTISGARCIGIRCFGIMMYKVRPHRTPPQGLIMMCSVLMYAILAFHILMHSVLSTYATYGSQKYCMINNSTGVCDPQPCNMDISADDCIMTRSSTFLTQLSYKAWIFGAAYFWMTWGFLLTFLLGLIVNIVRSKQSAVEELISRDDFDDSSEEYTRAQTSRNVVIT